MPHEHFAPRHISGIHGIATKRFCETYPDTWRATPDKFSFERFEKFATGGALERANELVDSGTLTEEAAREALADVAYLFMLEEHQLFNSYAKAGA